ncbi:MAG: cysteine--tRNA ligase [Patescibacteria group bacterium]|nr:cysteine--tRNA ligase [Patescibacteria group bacterium]
MRFYNTLSRQIEEFKPIKDGVVGIYSCGPTVYWNQHIGHMYAYVHWDVLVRSLRYLGFKVKWVMNITDVGHLTSDEDAGEDKMEKGAKREGLTVWEIADKYLAQFLESVDLLNIQRPDILCRATAHIQEQIDLIKKIEARGFTYKTKTGLVFETSKFSHYADFARLDLDKQEAGSRVEVDKEKKKPWDFLLWITNQPQHTMQWESPWGKGFPGWHIECTAMSTKYLGEAFDIHTGGKEHIPVHHTNEIAQAYGAFGRQTANYWLHNGWLEAGGGKMSKSLGNFITVSDLQNKGFEPLSLRYLILTSHYRSGLKFSWEALEGAQTALKNLRQIVADLRQVGQTESSVSFEKMDKIDRYRQQFDEALNNDLALPQALAVVWELVKSNIPAPDKLDLLLAFDQVLGLNLEKASLTNLSIPEEIKKLLEERDKLRKEGKWQEADLIRKKILGLGFMIKDTLKGVWARKVR